MADREREAFEALCAALPEGVSWGDPLTPEIARALSAQQHSHEAPDWHAHGMAWALCDESEGEHWTANDIACAYKAGALQALQWRAAVEASPAK
jgi:hypothetical protein